MTEKRFKLSKYITPTSTSYFHDEQGPMLNGEVVKMLNFLSEENEQLEKGKMEALSLLGEEIDKNEQLKKDDLLFFQQVFGILMKYQHLFNREMADEVLEDLGIELTEWFE